MKLYYAKGSCSVASHIIINELNISCEFVAVNFADKKTASGEDYLKLNPKGAVPALQLDNGEILTENAVIQQYLADTYKATTLLPPMGDFMRYRVLEWLNFAATDVHKSFGAFFNKAVPREVVESVFKPLLFKRLDFINQHLANHTYLVGKHFTLPDAYIFVTLTWLGHVGIDMQQWPNIVRYFEEIRRRPSVEKTFAEEGLSN